MRVKGIVVEDFTNYKLPSLFISTCYCDFKCCKEAGVSVDICQNAPLARAATKEVDNETILRAFVDNPITKAVVVGGMEPMLQIEELEELLKTFREAGQRCDFVIYTGYEYDEIKVPLSRLLPYHPIVVKFGRYMPNRPTRHDDILGVTLASDNQYAMCFDSPMSEMEVVSNG